MNFGLAIGSFNIEIVEGNDTISPLRSGVTML
jgi:hypothetical protein